MLNKAYRNYIYSPQWRAKCDLYWRTHGKYCQACGSRKKLHVHHMDYARFKNEPLTDLMGLCYTCHTEVHALHRKSGRKNLRQITMQYVFKKRGERMKLTFR